MADGTSFQIDVQAKADSAVSAADQLDRLGSSLDAAGKASTAAADQVKAGEAAYKQAETSADRAAKALEKIGIAADAQQGKLKAAMDAGDPTSFWKAAAALENLKARQAEATGKADAAKTALVSEAAALDKLKSAAKSAADEEAKVSKTLDDAKKAAGEADKAQKAAAGTGNARGIAAGLGKIGGPLGELGQTVFSLKGAYDKLGKSLGAAGPYVAAAAALALVVAAGAAAAVAIVVVTLKIAAWAVANADAARSQRLLVDGIAGTVAGGAKLDSAIDSLTKKVPQSRDELTQMASDLSKTGLKGDDLSKALETAAVKAAKLKFGPDFAKELLSIDHQSQALKDNLSGPHGVFSGLKIEGLLGSLSKLVSLFDSNTASGKAIKVVFESVFQPLIDGAAAYIPKLEAGFLQLIIAMLKVGIYVKQHGSQIESLAKIFGIAALVITGIFVIAIGLVILPFVLAAAAIFAVVAAIVWFISKIPEFASTVSDGIGGAWDWVVGKFNAAIDTLRSISLTDIGTQMIEGLVEGIKAAGGKVLAALTGVATGAVDGVKAVLHIKSPSRLLADEVGENMGDGVAVGIDKSGKNVQSSLEAITTPPDVSGFGASGGGGTSLPPIIININGVEGAEGAISEIRSAVLSVIESVVAKSGRAVPVG